MRIGLTHERLAACERAVRRSSVGRLWWGKPERLGADAFLLKPFTPKALRVSLEAMLRRQRTRSA